MLVDTPRLIFWTGLILLEEGRDQFYLNLRGFYLETNQIDSTEMYVRQGTLATTSWLIF